MKILHIVTGLSAGGAERATTDLAVAQSARGHEVRVASMLGSGHFRRVLDEAGVDVVDLGFRQGSLPVTGIVRTVRTMREFAPDIVHTTMLHANIAGRLARLLAPTRFLASTVQNVDERGDNVRPQWRVRARELPYRLTDRLADLTTQVSPLGARIYVERKLVSVERMCFVPNATDTSRFRPDESAREAGRQHLEVGPDDHVFLNVGSFHPQKAQIDMVHAFADAFADERTVDPDLPRRRLVIAGDGPLRPQIEAAVADRGLDGDVVLLGIRDDVVTWLNAADTFLLPSEFEGMPLALLEAMACGKPSVCTDVGANRLVLADAGRVIPPGDRGALVDALRTQAALPPAERKRLSIAARQRVEQRFSVRALGDAWLTCYERASAGRAPSRRSRPAGSIAHEIWEQESCDG